MMALIIGAPVYVMMSVPFCERAGIWHGRKSFSIFVNN